MENDTIRTSGGKTFVDVWIEGKVRGICVSRGAVEAYLGLSSERGAMSDEERCDFVRTHMALVMKAATQKLREMGMAAGDVVIEPGELGPSLTGRGGDRRKMQRRKGERRYPEGERALTRSTGHCGGVEVKASVIFRRTRVVDWMPPAAI